MKALRLAFVLVTTVLGCWADNVSGPNQVTLRRTPWGSIFYNPVATGPHKVESRVNEIIIRSVRGEVKVVGSELNDYRLSCGKDLLTIKHSAPELEIRWQDKFWKVHSLHSRLTLASNAPPDLVVFERNTNAFTIKGGLGLVAVNSNLGTLSIKGPSGIFSVITNMDERTFSGVPFDRIPYLGRGVFISFHGVGILIDIVRLFPMAELSEWIGWDPIIGISFNPISN